MRKLICQLCVVSMSAVAFVGCSSNKVETSSGSNTSSTNASSTDTKTSNEKIELRFAWWGGPERHEATLEVIEAYTAKNPHVTISAEYSGWDGYYQKLVTQLAGGTAADIIQIDYKWREDLRNQNKFFASPNEFEGIIDMSTFSPASLEAASVDGELQGIPSGLNAVTMIYNKKFFEEHNIPEDTVWNWDNLLEFGERVNQENPKHYLLNEFPNSISSLMSRYLNQQGKEFIKEDFTLGVTEEELIGAFEYITQLFEKKVIVPFNESALYADKTEQFPKWLNGEIGMFMQEASIIPALSSNFEVGVACIPMMPGAGDSGIAVKPTNILSINGNSKYKEEAAKFVNYMLNDEEAIKILGDSRGVPATSTGREVLESNNLLSQQISQAISIAEQFPGKPEHEAELNTELNKIIKEYIEQFGFGGMTEAEAAKGMITDLEVKLTEFAE